MTVQRLIPIIAVAMWCWVGTAGAQNSQSLGDVARQARQQKQQQEAKSQAAADQTSAVDPQPNDPNAKAQSTKAPHVYTNDEIPEHTGPDVNPVHREPSPHENYPGGKLSGEQWKSQILQQKRNIASVQKQIESIQNSIHFAGGNYERHVAYNERQREKQQQVENLQSQLAQMQKHLEDMQEAARHQGYSSVVYDP